MSVIKSFVDPDPFMRNVEPVGITFFCTRMQKLLTLVTEGHWDGWLCYKQADGSWVTLRRANREDRSVIMAHVMRGT